MGKNLEKKLIEFKLEPSVSYLFQKKVYANR